MREQTDIGRRGLLTGAFLTREGRKSIEQRQQALGPKPPWHQAVIEACASCHQSDMAVSSAQFDQSSYEGMLMGSRRVDGAKGNDVFGGGIWEESLLYENLYVKKYMPLGRPPEVPAEGPIVFAGIAVQEEEQ